MAGSEFWTAPRATDWIGALGGLSGAVALVITVWRIRRARRVPPAELRDRLLSLSEAFGDVVAAGGQESAWFLTADRRREEALLAALSIQIRDSELYGLVGEAEAHYRDAFALAPGHGMLSADPQRVGQQNAAARAGRTKVDAALRRLARLIREAA